MLRDHTIFNSPLKVDQTQAITISTPGAWSREIKEQTIEVLPIVADPDAKYRDGWCVYTYEHVQAPELEIMCGGVNAKTPRASAIWRQGFLMHFGFEPSPEQMNENGRSLLINSICYIAACRNDRPIVRTPSPSYSGVRMLDRAVIDRLVKNESRDLGVFLGHYLTPQAKKQTDGMTRDEVANWYRENRSFLRADDGGKFFIDEDARRLGVGVDAPEFFEAAIQAMAGHTDSASTARTLLARYAPEGPGPEAAVTAWQQWSTENRQFLFFTDTGGCCWLIDRLAKSRGVPTNQFRGSTRIARAPPEE